MSAPTRPATPQQVDWMVGRLEGMRLAREIAKAGGALTNPFPVESAQYAGFNNVANLHKESRMAGIHDNGAIVVPQGV